MFPKFTKLTIAQIAAIPNFFARVELLTLSAHCIRWVRADAGFYADNFLNFLEERQLPYLVVARLTTHLKSRLYQNHQWQAVNASYSVSEFDFKLWNWKSAASLCGDTRRSSK